MTDKLNSPGTIDLPNHWEWSSLEEIAEVVAGNPAPQGDEFFKGGTYPFVRVQDMGRLGASKCITLTNDCVNDKGAERLRLFPKGSVLFTKSGASTLLNQRAILVRDSYVVSHIALAIPKEIVLTEWVYYWLRTVDFAHLAHATTLPSLPLSKAKAIPIPIAPLEQQKRIVAEIEKQFSRLDEAVANLKRVKANLKRYKAAVLKAAVEGKLTEEWRKQHPGVEPADKLLERILAERREKWTGKGKYKEPVAPDTSKLPVLPEGWVWASGEQLFEWSSGDFLPASKTMSGEIPVYGGNGISGYHDLANVICPTIIIGRVGAQCGNVHISAGSCWVTDNAIYAKKLPGGVLLRYAALVFMVANLNKRAAGSGQPFVNQKMLNAIEVPLVPLVEQHQIVSEVERRLSIVAEAEDEVDTNLHRANRLRQSILKQAFSGQLVPLDPHDEPASVLLERIRANANVGAQHTAPRPAPKTHPRQPKRAQRTVPQQKAKSAITAVFVSLDAVISAILDRMQPGQEYSRADLANPLGLSNNRWNAAIQELKRRGQVRQEGERRGARYLRD